MTIEQLLGPDCSLEALEKMTDAELQKHFEPYLRVCQAPLTAPDTSSADDDDGDNFARLHKAKKPATKTKKQRDNNQLISEAMALAKQVGVELKLPTGLK